jgi:hypothetical protein
MFADRASPASSVPDVSVNARSPMPVNLANEGWRRWSRSERIVAVRAGDVGRVRSAGGSQEATMSQTDTTEAAPRTAGAHPGGRVVREATATQGVMVTE